MTNSIKNVIVIGANGLVGQQLVKLLNQLPECENITVVLRRPCPELNRLEKSRRYYSKIFYCSMMKMCMAIHMLLVV